MQICIRKIGAGKFSFAQITSFQARIAKNRPAEVDSTEV